MSPTTPGLTNDLSFSEDGSEDYEEVFGNHDSQPSVNIVSEDGPRSSPAVNAMVEAFLNNIGMEFEEKKKEEDLIRLFGNHSIRG